MNSESFNLFKYMDNLISLKVRDIVDKYRKERDIGSGNYGFVIEALDKDDPNRKTYALKS